MTLSRRTARLANSLPATSRARFALEIAMAAAVMERAEPRDSNDPVIRRLYLQVEEFLYPDWADSFSGGRNDIRGEENLLMDFYQGRLSEDDWAAIPRILAKARRRTEDVYREERATILQAMREGDGFVSKKTLQRLLGGRFSNTISRMSRDGEIAYTYYDGGGYTSR